MQEESKMPFYRVHTPLAALVHENDGRSRFISIPSGSVITLTGAAKQFDLVDVEWEGRALAVFNRDIEERTEKLQTATQQP